MDQFSSSYHINNSIISLCKVLLFVGRDGSKKVLPHLFDMPKNSSVRSQELVKTEICFI